MKSRLFIYFYKKKNKKNAKYKEIRYYFFQEMDYGGKIND